MLLAVVEVLVNTPLEVVVDDMVESGTGSITPPEKSSGCSAYQLLTPYSQFANCGSLAGLTGGGPSGLFLSVQ